MLLTGLPTEWYIPPKARVVVVADFFASDLLGGAELTTEALVEACPRKVFKVHSHSLTPEFLSENLRQDQLWVITNYANAGMEGLQTLVESGVRYQVVEYDWKFCRLRAPRTCAKDKQGHQCPCLTTKIGEVFSLVFDHAERVSWMSEAHMREHLTLSGREYNPSRHRVQGSTWSQGDLQFLRDLSRSRQVVRPNTWAVLESSSWIKGQKETEAWCRDNRVAYNLIGKLPYREFLTRLSEYQGLVFRPADRDTCPRIVVEARILGLDLALNENVQHQEDPWWKEAKTPEDLLSHLSRTAQDFWV